MKRTSKNSPLVLEPVETSIRFSNHAVVSTPPGGRACRDHPTFSNKDVFSTGSTTNHIPVVEPVETTHSDEVHLDKLDDRWSSLPGPPHPSTPERGLDKLDYRNCRWCRS